MKLIEDEVHMLKACTRLDSPRRKYILHDLTSADDVIDLWQVMTKKHYIIYAYLYAKAYRLLTLWWTEQNLPPLDSILLRYFK